MAIRVNDDVGQAVTRRYDLIGVDQDSRALSPFIWLVYHPNNRVPPFTSPVGRGPGIATTRL